MCRLQYPLSSCFSGSGFYSIVSVAVIVDGLVDPFEDLPVYSMPAAMIVPQRVSPGLEHGYRPHRGVREGDKPGFRLGDTAGQMGHVGRGEERIAGDFEGDAVLRGMAKEFTAVDWTVSSRRRSKGFHLFFVS